MAPKKELGPVRWGLAIVKMAVAENVPLHSQMIQNAPLEGESLDAQSHRGWVASGNRLRRFPHVVLQQTTQVWSTLDSAFRRIIRR